MSNYFKYWKPEGKARWTLCADTEEDIQKAIHSGATYTTVLALDQDVDHLDDGDGVKVQYKGPLYFDIDSEDEEKSLTDCRKLLLSLYADYGVNLSQVVIHCTGGKGFHILVYPKTFGYDSKKGNAYLPYTYKNVALAFNLEFLDYGIYSAGKGRMWRIENLKRQNGRYKVKLTPAQVFFLTMEEITTLTYSPGPVTVEPKQIDMAAELAALFKRSEYKPKKVQAIGIDRLTKLSEEPACIQLILAADRIKDGKRFNHVVMALASYAAGRGWNSDELIRKTALFRDKMPSSVYKSDRDKISHIKSIFKYFISSRENPQYQFCCTNVQSVVDVSVEHCPRCPLLEQITAEDYDPLLGLLVADNCFYKRTDSGKTLLTTFNIKPTSVITFVDDNNAEYTMHATLVSKYGRIAPIVFTPTDWLSKASFLKRMPHPDFTYLGGDTDVSRLFHVLGQVNVPKKVGVRTIGFHAVENKWHFVSHEGSLGPDNAKDELLLESDYNLHTKLLSEDTPNANELKELLDVLFEFNTLEVAVPLVGWFAATFFKERIFKITHQFPLLFIFGAAGSGKTQTILALKNLYALTNDNIKSIADLTNFTLIKSASSNNTIPLMLDEYKSSTFSIQQVKMVSKLIRAAYNNELGERGTTGQKIVQYFYKSPIIIAGEQTVSEPAAKDRIIEVHLTKATSLPHLNHFERLQQLPIQKLGRLLLETAINIDQKELHEMYLSCLQAVPEAYRDRPRVNQGIMLLGIKLLMRAVDMYGYKEKIESYIDCYWNKRTPYIEDEAKANSKSDVDRILEAINTMAENQRTALYAGTDFVIEGNHLKLNMRVIYANFMRFAEEYKLDADTPNYTSFIKLMKKEPYYIRDDQPTRIGQFTRLCMVLDVKKLKEKELNLACLIELNKPEDEGGELKP